MSILALLLAPFLPPCASEDAQMCVWDASAHGNGTGQSFVALWGGRDGPMSDIDLSEAIAAAREAAPAALRDRSIRAILLAATPLIEKAVREQIAREERDEQPSLTLWADGATAEQREVIYGAAVDAAFDASESMSGVSVGAVGSLSRGES